MSTRNIIRFVGGMFILQMITAVLSYSVILEPLLFKQNFIVNLADNSSSVTAAMFLDIATGLLVFGIAILLYPILKQYNERIAMWYVGLRLNELVCFVIAGILLLALLSISRNYTPEEASILDKLAYYIRNARGNVQDLALVVYCFGTSMFYFLLYKAKLVPRFIPAWGMLAVSLLFIEIVANIYRTSVGGIMIMMPLGLNELFLGFWLIFKGISEEVK